jgi:hypothetical protein
MTGRFVDLQARGQGNLLAIMTTSHSCLTDWLHGTGPGEKVQTSSGS